jgi:GT2 family glycosyltransferase
LSPHDIQPEHVVTAVIVAHDGAEWLPRVTEAVLGQTHPVQRVVAVDTGSRDRSGTLLADLLGPEAVFGMHRDTGYGAAVARAVQHQAAAARVLPSHQGGPGWGDQAGVDDPAAHARAGGYQPGRAARERPTEWIWLLHDDCEPDTGALAELLRGAAETPGVGVVGPKVLDWSDRRVILEAGLAIDTAGRRISGTEPREIDQGQHDGDRDVLAVSSAGMLARRDVWDEVGGFDARLALFRDDVDFCWRVHAAGYRVRLITDAVVYHLEASARGRRQTSAAPHPRRADRRNALFVLLANLPVPAVLAALAGNAALSAARIVFFLLAKRPQAARDEVAAFGYLLARPGLIHGARRRRRWRGGRRAYGALRSQVPRGRSLRQLAEFAAATLSPSSSRAEAVGAHHASDDPSDDDSLLTDSGLAQRILTNPGVLLVTALTVIALVSERSLLGAGPLGGGALLPAWGGASGLWSEYLAGFHAVGAGSAASTPPYVAVIAAVSTVLGGKPWLAMALILLGCVPLSGVIAYLASRRVSSNAAVRVWLAGSYALLPVATGAVAGGRFGTAVVLMLLPVIASTAGRMLNEQPRRARRAAWATGLLIAVAAAFVPLVWVVTVVIAALAGLAFARTRRAMAANLAIVALVPPVLLAPWTLDVARHPSMLLFEAGLQQPGLASRNLPARSLLLLGPGGPGTPPVWVTAGLVLAALAALLLRRRGFAVAAAWGVALSGLLTAIVVSRFAVSPSGGGPVLPAWPGIALLVAAIGLLLAVAAVGDDLPGLFAAGGLTKAGVSVMAIAACAPPLLTAGYWLVTGVAGPVTNVAGPVLPEFVSVSSAAGLHLRTLVLRPGRTSVGYTLLRDGDAPVGAEALTAPAAAGRALDRAVATLTARYGSGAGDAGAVLAQFAIGYVLLPAPVDPGLARLLDGVVGLRPLSQTPSFELWRVAEPAARASVVEPSGARVVLPSGPVNVSAAAAPTAGGTLVLAEPASGSWHAALDGRPLTPLPAPVYGWAQGFRLPAGGGRIDITRDETGRTLVVAAEAVILVVVAALALPGARHSVPDARAAGAAGRARRSGQPSAANGQGTRGRARPVGAGGRGVRGRDKAAGVRHGGRGGRGVRPRGRPRADGSGAEAVAGARRMPTDRAAGGGRARVPEGQMPEGQMPEGQMPADLSADGVPLDLGIGRDQAAENPAAQPDEASEAGWLPSGSGSRPRAWPGSRRDEADS